MGFLLLVLSCILFFLFCSTLFCQRYLDKCFRLELHIWYTSCVVDWRTGIFLLVIMNHFIADISANVCHIQLILGRLFMRRLLYIGYIHFMGYSEGIV